MGGCRLTWRLRRLSPRAEQDCDADLPAHADRPCGLSPGFGARVPMLRTRNSVRRAPRRVSRRHGRPAYGSQAKGSIGKAARGSAPGATTGPTRIAGLLSRAPPSGLAFTFVRPPDHGAVLLANAQISWLSSGAATAAGWRSLPDAIRRKRAPIRAISFWRLSRTRIRPKPGISRSFAHPTSTRRHSENKGRSSLRRGATTHSRRRSSAASPITGARGRPTEAALCDFSPTP